MFRFGAVKKAQPAAIQRPDRFAGLDANASRARAVAAGDGRMRPLHLNDPHDDLPFFAQLECRSEAIGHSARSLSRKIPHSICSGYFALLGQPTEWRGSRRTFTPETATQATFDALRAALAAEVHTVGLALPAYFTPKQVRSVLEIAHLAGVPVCGSVCAPLAVVAHRANTVGPGGTVLLIDADEHALSASLVSVHAHDVRLVGSASWPQASLKLWRNRLIDGISDRCVRVCRRDPRDSGDAEQIIYDQLDAAMDQARLGQKATISLRNDHWYQDITLSPEELENIGLPMLHAAIEGLKQLLMSQSLNSPPRAVWFMPSAARLPGLAAKMYRHSPEQTAISILPENAIAEATAALVPRWLENLLPKSHADGVLPWERLVNVLPAEPPPVPEKLPKPAILHSLSPKG